MSLGTEASGVTVVMPKTAAPPKMVISFARKFLWIITAPPSRAVSLYPWARI